MIERPTKVAYLGSTVDGVEVPVSESTERWTEVNLEDGTVIRVKTTVIQAVRVTDKYDNDGNPQYLLKTAPVVTIVHVEEKLRRKAQ